MKFRPICATDYEWFRVPPLPETAVGWVLNDPRPVGFAAVDSVPGLPGLADLYLYILPSLRNQGYGERLLIRSLLEANQIGYKTVSTFVEDEKGRVARFLKSNKFYIEHQELLLGAEVPTFRPAISDKLITLPADKTYKRLLELYDASFSAEKWYQPFVSEFDVKNNLVDNHEIFYLQQGQTEIAFAMVEFMGTIAEIEPFGVIKSAQSQGIGRKLMQALFHEFSKRGVKKVQLTVWNNNYPALALYESFGFKSQSSRTFFAYDIVAT